VLKKELLTLFSTEKSAPLSLDGSLETTTELTNTPNTLISALRKKLTMMGLFFRYLC
jgi:hypothetical protein